MLASQSHHHALRSLGFLRATDARKQAHAAEPPGPGQAAAPVFGRRRDALRQCPITLAAGETEHAGRRIRGEPAALTPATVGAAGEAPLLPRRRRSAGGGEALVVHRLLRQPPLLDCAADERDNPLHAHVATICTDPEQQRSMLLEIYFFPPGEAEPAKLRHLTLLFFLKKQKEHEIQ